MDETDQTDMIVNDEDLEEVIELEDIEDPQNEKADGDDDDDDGLVECDKESPENDDGLEDEEDLLEDESVFTFKEHQQPVFCCAVSKDDKIVVTGGQDDKAFVWATDNGQVKFQTTGHKDSVTFVKFNCNSTMIATGDHSGVIFVWDLDGTKLHELDIGQDLFWLEWHPQAQNVLVAGTNQAWMWKLSETNPRCKIFSDIGVASTIGKIFKDGQHIALGYEDGALRIWDLKEKEREMNIPGNHDLSGSILSMDINSDDSLVAAGSENGMVKIFNVKNQKFIKNEKFSTNDSANADDCIESILFSGKDILVIGSLNGFIQVWHLPTNTKRNEIKLVGGICKMMIDQNNANTLYVGCLDSIFRVLELRTCEVILTKSGHQDKILDFSISSDSKYVLTCSDDCTCKIFKLNNE